MQRKRIFGVLLGILMRLLPESCLAAEIIVGPTVPSHSEILFKGDIGPDLNSDLEKLKLQFQIFHQRELVTLILDSPGGYVDDALKQSTVLSELDEARGKGEYSVLFNHVSSLVRSGTQCTSACVVLFFAFEERSIERGALIGVHRAAIRDGDNLIENDQTRASTKQITTFLKAHGASDSVIRCLESTPPSAVSYLNPIQLLQSRVSIQAQGAETPPNIEGSFCH